ncbi:ABC transporter substrate-binding protein [Paenibacillus mendelii]|uniref:ABC transporter substrate-binding protein n=1 Tax=Paenibacillus mendelii TaxID=206163 RepID=A0ABV6J3T4_9BACL|nr:extracellular solute-binding protein [Paenibacillus mendelii]MCQ6563922.1 extracellular solute-binding protein [Paenibacillus mendelii]
MKRTTVVALTFVLTVLIIAGCSSNNGSDSNSGNQKGLKQDTSENVSTQDADGDAAKPVPAEQVTIKLLSPFGAELSEKRYRPIEKILPNIKLEIVEGKLEELHAQNIVPDIVVTGWGFSQYEKESSEPLDDLINKHQFDLEALNSSLVAAERASDKENRLMSLPNSNDVVVMYYNKTVFDKFGVSYPTDNMTWDDVIDAAKQMTAERDGVKYRGLEMRSEIGFGLQQFGVNLTDPATGDVLFAKDPRVIKYFELLKKIYSIPGMTEDTDPFGPFLEGRVGMLLTSAQYMRWAVPADLAARIDFAAAPVWADNPGTTMVSRSYSHNMINKYSEHKDEAFQVLAAYYSPEIQTMLTRGAEEVTPLTDQSIQAQFGADLPNFQGKNVKAIFMYTPAKPPQVISSWDAHVNLDQGAFITSEMNIPEFLRVKTEEAQIKIKEAKGQQ